MGTFVVSFSPLELTPFLSPLLQVMILGGNVSAPGIFLDPCPTGDLLGGALRGRT